MFGHQGAHMSGLEALFDSILLQKDMMKYHLVQLDPEELRMMGNKFYRSNDHWHAISAYTKSLARAPAGSELRGLAYANRSAVLLTLGYYEECISDAKIAMENNYPENLAQKLQMRMAVAYKALGKEAEAQESLQVALKLIEDRKMRPEVEEAVIKSLRDELEEDHVPQVPHMRVEYAEPPQLSYGPNPEDPRLSAAVTASDGFLTHTLKANRNINVGDVILVEEPVIYETTCVVSEGEAAWIYCSECLKLCVNLKPCSTCSWACYCSEECASRAWEKFHKNECSAKQKVLETLIKKNDGKIPINFRSVDFLFKVIAVFGLENCINALDKDGALSDDITEEIESFLELKTSSLGCPTCVSAGDKISMELIADSLGLTGERKEALINFFKDALYFMLSNWRPIHSAKLSRIADFFFIGQYQIGVGLYMKAAVINGSCEPNVRPSFYQKTLVLQASRPIKEGEEIFQSKGIDYCYDDLEERRKKWEMFNHECKCDACVGNWPMQEDLVPCHEFVSNNPDYESLKRQWQDEVEDFSEVGFPFEVMTAENFELSAEIQALYVNQRRDDKQFNRTIDFLEVYFASLTKKFHIDSDDVEHLSQGLHHYVSATGVRLLM